MDLRLSELSVSTGIWQTDFLCKVTPIIPDCSKSSEKSALFLH